MGKQKLNIEWYYDRSGKGLWIISSPKGGDLSLSDIHNELVNGYGGGVYALVLNCNSGELTDKINRVEVYDISDLEV